MLVWYTEVKHLASGTYEKAQYQKTGRNITSTAHVFQELSDRIRSFQQNDLRWFPASSNK